MGYREGTPRVQVTKTITTTSQAVLAANLNHGIIEINNQSAQSVFLKYGAVAVADGTSIEIVTKTTYTSPYAVSQSVNVICPATTSVCCVGSDTQ